MAINIKDPTTEGLARELAVLKGGSITEAIRSALEAELAKSKAEREAEVQRKIAAINALVAEVAKMPVADPRPVAEIRKELWGGRL